MIKILLVDDETFWLHYYKELIESKFHNLIQLDFASSAKDAIDIIKKNKPNLLITDLEMERIEEKIPAGEYLIKETKKLYSDLPIIIVSGAPDIMQVSQRQDLGKNFIQKPLLLNNPLNLSLKISEVLNLKIETC